MQNYPAVVPTYCGQNQQQQIVVPAAIAYKSYEYSPEEGCWGMLPYSYLYPQPPEPSVDYLPPSIGKTDLWRAQGTWPL